MSVFDNGGIVGRKLDLNNIENYLNSSTGTGIEYVGGVTGTMSPSTTVGTTVSLTALTGGSDVRPFENDLVLLTYGIASTTSVDPGAFTSTGTATTDSWCAATLALKPAAGQSISYVGGTTARITGSTATTTNVNLPAGTTTDDLVVVSYSIGSTVSRTAQFSISTYTATASLTQSDTYVSNLGVFYKKMGATPDTTVTIPATGAIADAGAVAIQVFRGVDTTNPLDNTTTTATAANGRRANPPLIYVYTQGSFIVACGSGAHVAGQNETFTAGTGYTTDFQTIATDNTTDATVGMGYRSTSVNMLTDNLGAAASPEPTGYTQVAKTYAIGSSSVAFGVAQTVMYKKMTSTPDTSISLPPTNSSVGAGAYAVQVWRNVDTTTPMDVTDVSFTQSGGSSNGDTTSTTGSRQPNPPSITPVTSGAVVVAMGAAATQGSTTFTNAGLTNFLTSYGNSTYDCILGMYSAAWTSGAYDPPAFTVASDDTNSAASSVTVALRPATITTTTTANKTYSGLWNNRAKFLSKAQESEVAKIVGYSTAYVTATATSVNIVLPTDIKRNDLILIFAGNGVATAAVQFDNTTYKPTNFTLVKYDGSSTTAHCAAFYKVASGTEGGTTINVPAQTSDPGLCAAAFVIRGALASSPIGNIGVTLSVDAVTTATMPGIETSRNHSIVFCIAWTDGSDTLPIQLTSPSSLWLNRNSIFVAAGGSTGAAGIIAWKFINSSGASSESATLTYQVSDGVNGFQFEVKSVY